MGVPDSGDLLADGRVPQPHRPIPMRGNEMPAVEAKGETYDCVAESAQAGETIAGPGVPDSHFIGLPANSSSTGGEALPIRAEAEAPAVLRLGERQEHLTRVAIPQFHGAGSNGRQPMAVGMESNAQNAGCVNLKWERFLAQLLFQ